MNQLEQKKPRPRPSSSAGRLETPVEELFDQHIRARIEECAQAALDVRGNYSDASLADLYDPNKMPTDLQAAHHELDMAIEAAYDVDFNGDEEKLVAHLFRLYAEATKEG